jgi:hypothetical protein
MPVAALSLDLARRIALRPRADLGPAAGMVCLQMRRDARAGADAAGDVLTLGGHRWQALHGWWCRDGVARLAIDAVAWDRAGAVVEVRLTPHQLGMRSIELEATP